MFSGRCADGWVPFCAYQEEAPQGIGHRHRFGPIPCPYLLDLREIPGSNPENDSFRGNLIGFCPFQERGELTERPRADEVEWSDLLAELFIAAREDLNVCLLYTSPSPRDRQKSRMPSSA